MRALTIREPWATAIVWGPKRVENRPWKVAAGSIGARIALHVGVQITPKERNALPIVRARITETRRGQPGDVAASRQYEHALHRLRLIETIGTDADAMATLGVGAIIGVATIRECIAGPARAIALGQSAWFTGPFALVLDDVRPIFPFIPMRGYQRFWNLSDTLSRQVEERVQEAA